MNRILPHLLPPEDLRNPCLDVLVSEIFAEMIIRNGICGKVSEPWLIWDGITKAIYAARPELRKSPTAVPLQESRLDRFGLLAGQIPESSVRSRKVLDRLDAVRATFWSILQAFVTTVTLLRSILLLIVQASSLPARGDSRSHNCKGIAPSLPAVLSQKDAPDVQGSGSVIRPIVAIQIWACVSQILLLDQRMPWLAGLLALFQFLSIEGPGKVCCANSRLDR